MLDAHLGTHLRSLSDTILLSADGDPAALFSENSSMGPQWFLRLDAAGPARSIPEVLIRGRAMGCFYLHNIGAGRLDGGPALPPDSVRREAGPRNYRDAMDECIRDLMAVTALPPGKGGHEATRLLAIVAPVSLDYVEAALRSSILSWRLMRVPTWVLQLIYGPKPQPGLSPKAEPFGEHLTALAADQAREIVRQHLLSPPVKPLYPARSLAIEAASFVPRPSHEAVSDDDWATLGLAQIALDTGRSTRERQYAHELATTRGYQFTPADCANLSADPDKGVAALRVRKTDPKRPEFPESTPSSTRYKAVMRVSLPPLGKGRGLNDAVIAAATLADGSARRAWLDAISTSYRYSEYADQFISLLSSSATRSPAGWEFLSEVAIFCASYAAPSVSPKVLHSLSTAAGLTYPSSARFSSPGANPEAHVESEGFIRWARVRLAALMGIADLSQPLEAEPAMSARLAIALTHRANDLLAARSADPRVDEIRRTEADAAIYCIAFLREQVTGDFLGELTNGHGTTGEIARWGVERIRLRSTPLSTGRRFASPFADLVVPHPGC